MYKVSSALGECSSYYQTDGVAYTNPKSAGKSRGTRNLQ